MNLSVVERLSLFEVLATQQGNFDTLRLVRELRERLGLTDEEAEEINFRPHPELPNRRVWNGDIDREFDFSPREVEVITKALNDVSKRELATEAHLALYERFVNEK